MIIRQGYKYRLDPSDAQGARFRVLCGHPRFLWNKALERCNKALESGEYVPRYNTMAKWITDWKNQPETDFLKEAYTDNLQQKLKDLDTAWQRYFKKVDGARRPRFKQKGKSRDSIRFVNFHKYCEIKGNRVKLPAGIGWVKFRKSRDIVGTIKNCTIGFEGGHWHISFQTEREIETPTHPSTSITGLDMGVAKFVTQSDGKVFKPLSALINNEAKLAKEQRKLSHKVKFSANWKKQKVKINQLHHKIAQCRNDFLHKASAIISYNHAMVIIEDLQVANMSKSAKGDSEQPGKNVKQKSGLNKSILDQGWHEFRRQLEYKQLWQGGEVIAVPAHYTSQKCPSCAHVSKGNRKTQAAFKCVECGFEQNADVVGAMNVLAAGQALLASVPEQSGAVTACEVNRISGQQQEPVQNREGVAPQAVGSA